MYDFGLSCPLPPDGDAGSLWIGVVAPAFDVFLHNLDSERLRFFRPDSVGRWNEELGTLHRYQSEVFFQIGGRCEFTFPAEKFELTPGDVLLVPLGMPHLERAEHPVNGKFFNLVLTVSEGRATLHVGVLASPGSGNPKILVRRPLSNQLFYRGAVTALSSFSSFASGSGARGALLEALLRQLAEDAATAVEPDASFDEPYSFAHRAKAKLDEEGRAVALDVGGLALELGCSPGYLSHSFHRIYGVPLKHYIRALRLEYARQLLSSGDCNIAETAERCGFRDASYFSRQFRQCFGISPGKLR